MSVPSPSIVWFSQCLRTNDNQALWAGLNRHGPVIPVYIWDPEGEAEWPLGEASRWWLHHSLISLREDLAELGLPLVILRGRSDVVLSDLAAQTKAKAIFWNRRYEPAILVRDGQLKSQLIESGIDARSFNDSLLFEPSEIETASGNPYQVFTPFWKACLAAEEPAPPIFTSGRKSQQLPAISSLEIDDLDLLPKIAWDEGLRESWQPGSAGAHSRLKEFLDGAIGQYKDQRNRPSEAATSRLSPHLHFGEISPREIWSAVKELRQKSRSARLEPGIQTFLSELGWREFSYHILYHFPLAPSESMKSRFEGFPWEEDPQAVGAWQRGRTGYPLVDAGMRELWATGWMHNRVRMVVASFLTKDLLISWQHGAEWFWDTLVDADLASNSMGWQWTAGCGADAAPYFRVFNPTLQSEKFDPQGEYLRSWVPELADLPNKWIHKPWEAPADVLSQAGVELGRTYPRPIVDHKEARKRALDIHSGLTSG